jgi:deazaflavin-dependent oxidoreductase (nitroreductase family)
METGAVRRTVNKVIHFLVGTVGLNLQGAEVLEVRGRKSGEVRSQVVNPLPLDGEFFLISSRGESSWVKNIRAAGEGRLRRGRRSRSFRIHELTDEEKMPVLRAYLVKWGWEVKSIMGVDGSISDDELRAILPKHPVFRLTFTG